MSVYGSKERRQRDHATLDRGATNLAFAFQQHQEVIVAGKGVRTRAAALMPQPREIDRCAELECQTHGLPRQSWAVAQGVVADPGSKLRVTFALRRQVMAPATRDFRRAIAETRGPSRGRSPRADSTRARWTRRGVGEQRLVVFTEQTCDVSDVVLCCPSHSAGGCAQVHRPYS